MRKFLVSMVALLACMTLSAQTPQSSEAPASNLQSSMFNAPSLKFGYLSYSAALKSMGAYATVQQQMTDLKAQYEAEMQRVEKDFNRKYEEFLDGQRDFPKTILQKRQTELQEMMEKNIAFREKSRAELARAEQEAMAPLRIQLIELIGTIAREQGFAFIYDTDTKALPFVNIDFGTDINQLVQDALNAHQ